MKTRVKFLVACFLIFLINYDATGQNDEKRKLAQMYTVGLIFTSDGYEITHNPETGNLYSGESQDHYFKLKRGWKYQICAYCDTDCGDLDICLYHNKKNIKIGCDKEADDIPMLTVTPRRTTKYKVRIHMYNCEINPCGYGIIIYGKKEY